MQTPKSYTLTLYEDGQRKPLGWVYSYFEIGIGDLIDHDNRIYVVKSRRLKPPTTFDVRACEPEPELVVERISDVKP